MLGTLGINTKMTAVLLCMALTALIAAAYSGHKQLALDDLYARLLSGDAAAQVRLERANQAVGTLGRLTYMVIAEDRYEELKKLAEAQSRNRETFVQYLKDAVTINPQLETEAADLTARYDALAAIGGRIADAVGLNDLYTAQDVAKREFAPAFAELEKAIAHLVDESARAVVTTSERTTAAAKATVTTILLLVACGSGVLLTVALLVIRRSVTGPLLGLTDTMQSLAAGNLRVSVEGTARKDEIGAIARSVEVFKTNAETVRALEQEQQEQARRAEQEKQAALSALADSFEQQIQSVVEALSTSARTMEDRARTMTQAAHQASHQGAQATSAASEASGNVQTMASAAEELTASIQEIVRQVEQASSITGEAVAEAEETGAVVETLSAAVARIDEVISLIDSIASQTNLLALNATIEAARARDNGKGFAVVANEVKTLAGQTAKATGEIARQIVGVRDASGRTLRAMHRIRGVITRIDEVAASIASAVEQQGAATQEIARNAGEAAMGTGAVRTGIADIVEASGTTEALAGEVLSVSGDISRQSETLRHEVDRFIRRVRGG
ncbi:methyl-accepting chemotaxis protein [Novispirillum itersonii]|uniref:Methyl-accepting chemotaxis protein n=1 Tax=Novispirillum itersonii TaxID=189 RepID=A0A7X0DKM8_NOVIT|nr:HAMP domain-containing methyl-accepting chemotaxis protein [Novispirillum itersonii]MBB6209085.1 methyl-accepting chemotaxis protein [Novispirillum itersonii]